MAVINCDITRDGVRIEEGKRWAQIYKATYQIETDTEMGPIAVQVAARGAVTPRPVPEKGDSYSVASETDLASFALDFNWRRDPKSNKRWFCDVIWRPLDPKDSIDNLIEPIPVNRDPVLWWEFEDTTEVVRKAKNITAMSHISRAAGTLGEIVNAAGVPYDTLPERPKSRPVLVLQRNYSTLDKIREVHDTYIHKLNAATYRGGAAKTWFVRSITSSPPTTENGYTYYQGQIRLAYDPNTWKFTLVNQGLSWLDGTWTPGSPGSWSPNPPKLKKTDANAARITEPQLLTATGQLVNGGAVGNDVEYEYADTVSFTDIELEP